MMIDQKLERIYEMTNRRLSPQATQQGRAAHGKEKNKVPGETAVEKPLRGKVQKQTFPPSLQIAQKARDSHFPTAATGAGLRLHFQCLDNRPLGYIFKWLDTDGKRKEPRHGSCSLVTHSVRNPVLIEATLIIDLALQLTSKRIVPKAPANPKERK
jgi:hypothetical protein